MSKILNISEAATIAIHSMVLIAASDKRLNVGILARNTQFSRNHIAKVLNQLVKYGFLVSERGPDGGFNLAREADRISLLEIYESIEGSLDSSVCDSRCDLCLAYGCVFGGLSYKFQQEFRDYLRETTLKDIIKIKKL